MNSLREFFYAAYLANLAAGQSHETSIASALAAVHAAMQF